MNVVEINNPNEWDLIVRSLSSAPSFLQSSAWGICLEEEGKKITSVVVEDRGSWLAAALLVEHRLPLGLTYLFCPGGPIINDSLQAGVKKVVLESLCEFAKKKQYVFVRIEPEQQMPKLSVQSIKALDINPSTTTVLDLHKPLEQIVAAMPKKTRYSLRKAAESNLQIKSEKNIDILLNLLKTTGERDGFRLHHTEHYVSVLASEHSLQLTAYLNNVPVATAVWFGFAGTITYLYAASTREAQELYAPYALQEAILKYAQESGYKAYDFFGIAPNISKNFEYDYDHKHEYAGITKFKLGFGGEIISRPGTHDLIVSPFKYFCYKIFRKLRRLL